MSYTVRDAKPSECESLSDLALRSKAMWGYDADFMKACRDELRVEVEAVNDGRVRVLEIGDQILGMYAWTPLENGRVDLGHLFLEPEHTRRGHGIELWRDLVATLRARGYECLEVVSDPQAEPFYLARGCVRMGERPSGSIAGRSLPYLEYRL